MAIKSIPSAKKATVVEDVAPKAEACSFQESLFMTGALPSGKRVVVTLIIGVIIGASVGYLGVHLALYVATAAALFTGSLFLAFILEVLGYVLALLASVIVCGRVQTFILSGDIDRCYQNVSNRVTGWFGSARNMVTS